MKLFFLFISLFPLSIYAQSVQGNLDYINAQFEKYNKYETRFEVDDVAKTITCQDKFGAFVAFFEDIEFKLDANGKNIGIFCLDQSTQCISTIQNEGIEGPTYSKYTMDLLENNEPISHLDQVLEKFIALKTMMYENGTIAYSSQVQRLKYSVDLHLQELNIIFKKQASNQTIWSFDWDNYWLVGKTDSCKTFVPLENVSVEYHKKESEQLIQHGFIFQSVDYDILKKCKTAEEKLQNFSGYLDSLTQTNKVVDLFKKIQLLIGDGPESLSPAMPKVSTDQLLIYINSQFKKYNQYDTRFFVESEKKELIWIQAFGETRVSIDQIDVRADYENGWLVIFCKDKSNRCIYSFNGAGKTRQSNEYSMSLKENDAAIEHIDEVVIKLKELLAEVAN